MKLLGIIAVSTLGILLASACATSSPPNAAAIRSSVQSTISSGTVYVLFQGSTVTLTGVASRVDANKAVRAAQSAEGVDQVYNRLSEPN